MKVAALLILRIIEEKNAFGEKRSEKRTVLIFLPGLLEIFQLIEMIESENSSSYQNLLLIPLHSSLGE